MAVLVWVLKARLPPRVPGLFLPANKLNEFVARHATVFWYANFGALLTIRFRVPGAPRFERPRIEAPRVAYRGALLLVMVGARASRPFENPGAPHLSLELSND